MWSPSGSLLPCMGKSFHKLQVTRPFMWDVAVFFSPQTSSSLPSCIFIILPFRFLHKSYFRFSYHSYPFVSDPLQFSFSSRPSECVQFRHQRPTPFINLPDFRTMHECSFDNCVIHPHFHYISCISLLQDRVQVPVITLSSCIYLVVNHLITLSHLIHWQQTYFLYFTDAFRNERITSSVPNWLYGDSSLTICWIVDVCRW